MSAKRVEINLNCAPLCLDLGSFNYSPSMNVAVRSSSLAVEPAIYSGNLKFVDAPVHQSESVECSYLICVSFASELNDVAIYSTLSDDLFDVEE